MIKTEKIMSKSYNKTIVTKESKKTAKKKKNRFLLIFICIFMSVIIVVGAVLGIIAYVKRKNATVIYGSYMLDEGETNYFASYFKYRFLIGLSDAGISGYDTEWFWEMESDDEVPYGELLKTQFRDYISGILVANALFDEYSKLEKGDKAAIEEIAEDALIRHGSEEAFNEAASKYGFDFEDYKTAVEYIYKAAMAQSVIFGTDGANLALAPEECESFYENNYSRVSLLFLRDEEIVETDANGISSTRPITNEEKAIREGYKEGLRLVIGNSELGTEDKLKEYERYYKLSDSDMERYRSYYFANSAEATNEFATAFPDVVEAALSMNEGEYVELECSIGTCFIYKEALDELAYTDSTNPFFSDFYADAVFDVYSSMLELYSPDVEFTDRFDGVDIVGLPKNYEFVISVMQ